MTLKELIKITDRETLVCVCDNFGPNTEVVKLKEVPLVCLMYDLDRKVKRIYIDTDNSLTIELEDWIDDDSEED